MTARPTAVITDAHVSLTFPYSARLIDMIKTGVPYPSRSYDPPTKTWTVREPYMLAAIGMIKDTFPQVVITDQRDETSTDTGQSASTSSPPRLDPDYGVLHLLPTASLELVESAYRVLAKANHPDRGGSTETMTKINSAVSAICERAS